METMQTGAVSVMKTQTMTESEKLNISLKFQPLSVSNKDQDLETWQVEKIKKGLAQADRGEFVSDDEMKKFFVEWE